MPTQGELGCSDTAVRLRLRAASGGCEGPRSAPGSGLGSDGWESGRAHPGARGGRRSLRAGQELPRPHPRPREVRSLGVQADGWGGCDDTGRCLERRSEKASWCVCARAHGPRAAAISDMGQISRSHAMETVQCQGANVCWVRTDLAPRPCSTRGGLGAPEHLRHPGRPRAPHVESGVKGPRGVGSPQRTQRGHVGDVRAVEGVSALSSSLQKPDQGLPPRAWSHCRLQAACVVGGRCGRPQVKGSVPQSCPHVRCESQVPGCRSEPQTDWL